MRLKGFPLHALIAGALLALAAPAAAITFNLIDYAGTVSGTPAAQGFAVATDFWSSVLRDDFTVNLEIGYAPLGAGVMGDDARRDRHDRRRAPPPAATD